MAQILLTHTDVNSGDPVHVTGKNISINYKKGNSGSPNANYDGDSVPERISGNVDTPLMVIKGTLDDAVATIGGNTVITQALLKDFFAVPNIGSDPVTLNIQYGSSTQWKSFQKVSSVRVDEIPVTLASLSINLDANDTINARKPSFTLTLEEVKQD